MKKLLYLFMVMSVHLAGKSQSGFSAQLNIPEDVVQGESCEFELEIYKPEDVRGFAMFTQEFPEGFYVEAIENDGAEFSYENNTLTLTWLRIQPDPKVTVLYEVSPMYGVTGEFTFSGRLSYMVGSKQANFDLKEYPLNVLKEKKVVQTKPDPENQYTGIILNKNLYKDISCVRKATFNEKKNEYTVEVTIKKEGGGSYHLIEQLPKGFTFEESSTTGAKLSRTKDKVSFLWNSVPDSKEFSVKYKLIPIDGKKEKPAVTGKLSVLRNGQLIEIPVIN